MSCKLELETILGSSTAKINQVAFAQDCLLYVAGSNLVFYNPVVDEQIAFLQHPSPQISAISVSKCQQFLAISAIDIDITTNQNISHNESEFSSQSKNKKGYSQSTVTIYKLGEVGIDEPKVVQQLKGHKYAIDHLLYSPDGKYLVSICNTDGSLFVWNCTSGERVSTNKNSRKINCVKFMGSEGAAGYDLVTAGRGFCKIWGFVDGHTKKLARVHEDEHWMLVGRTVSLSRKLATKEFVQLCFWNPYIILLTHDGLLCLIAATPKAEKLDKCIDLMIEKTTSMDLYRDKLMCGGHNSLVKVIDLDSLSLVARLPKPPPVNKENISKDCEDEEVIVCYDESEDFPQCVGVRTVGGDSFCQFIVTLYENQTMFIWRPEPTIAAMRSIITHHSSIKLIKVLDETSNELTFFGTLSSDCTVRIWHIYKKWIQNRESIDIASLIGIKRNAYCRNLTRILYLQAENQVTHMAAAGGLDNKCIACIANREFLVYSLHDFEVIGHQNFEDTAVALQIKDQVAYIGFQNGKVGVYQLLIHSKTRNIMKNMSLDFELEEEESTCTVNKVREISFQLKIKDIKIVEKSPGDSLLLLLSAETHELVVYSIQKSAVVHVEKNVSTCSWDNSHIVMAKTVDNMKVLYTYSIKKGKTSKFLSLTHELDEDESILHIRCNSTLIAILTSHNKIIVSNFAPAIVCVQDQISEPINDMQLSENGEILVVGDYGAIRVYRLKGQNEGMEEMEGEVKKWMDKNELSWLDNSVWAKRRNSMDGDRSLSGNRLLAGSVQSVRLAASGNKTNLQRKKSTEPPKQAENKKGEGVEGVEGDRAGDTSVYGTNQKALPDVEIKYKSDRNDQSIFNPGKIGEQMKGLIANLKPPKINKTVNEQQLRNNHGQSLKKELSLEEIKMEKHEERGASSLSKPINRENEPVSLGGASRSKKRIFQNPKKEGEGEQQYTRFDDNNLVDSVVHSSIGHSKRQVTTGNFAQFHEYSPSSKINENLSFQKQSQLEFHNLSEFELLLGSKKYVQTNYQHLARIYARMGNIFSSAQNHHMVSSKYIELEFDRLALEFKNSLKMHSVGVKHSEG